VALRASYYGPSLWPARGVSQLEFRVNLRAARAHRLWHGFCPRSSMKYPLTYLSVVCCLTPPWRRRAVTLGKGADNIPTMGACMHSKGDTHDSEM
jgi:hypothetical protein